MQQINLYQAEFKPKAVPLPPRQMFQVILVMLAIFTVISLYQAKKNSVLETIIANTQTHQAQPVAIESSGNSLLQAELNQLKQQYIEKESLLTYLTHHDFGNQLGFSATLTSLAQQRIDNVWLTAFSFTDSGHTITLDGKALQSSQIPMYIDSLAKSEHFQGKQFSVFQLQKPDDDSGIYTFQLHTKNSLGK